MTTENEPTVPTIPIVVPLTTASPCCSGPGRTTSGAETPSPTSTPTLPPPTRGPVVETVVRDQKPPHPAPDRMAWIKPGRYTMGSDFAPFARDARPLHLVEIDGFYLDRYLVTNAQFARFVKATKYVTIAEQAPDPALFPGVPPGQLVAGSTVFMPPDHPVPLDRVQLWWRYVPGAYWQTPEGPGSDLTGRDNHPVVQVCWEDAAAYARWAGKRLPTEAEWEYAARAGLTQKPYVWGDDFTPNGKHMANLFQGNFPNGNTADDGWERTSPVGAFPANRWGLYDMSGNVWEWCADWYRPDYYHTSPRKNPTGPRDSVDPDEPSVPKRVQRGGSFLCTDQYCSRYMPGGRGKGDVWTGSSNVGFRCAISAGDVRKVRKGSL